MTAQKPFTIPTSATLAKDTPISPDRIVSGAPLTGILPSYENQERGFYVGQWASDIGAWRVSYTEDELCTILSGSGKLRGDDGSILEFEAGQSFVIPRGFQGIWETTEPVRKIYAIVE